MLQKCYNRNNSVTNVKSGSRIDNVRSGHQNVHPKNWKEDITMSTSTIYTISDHAHVQTSWKLEAENKLEAGR